LTIAVTPSPSGKPVSLKPTGEGKGARSDICQAKKASCATPMQRDNGSRPHRCNEDNGRRPAVQTAVNGGRRADTTVQTAGGRHGSSTDSLGGQPAVDHDALPLPLNLRGAQQLQ
jgi:hypothetical protein